MMNHLLTSLRGVEQNSLRGVKVVDRVNSETASSFFKIHINGTEKMMHKQTACWHFTEEKKSLSADRVRRVIEGNAKRNHFIC